MIESCMRSLYLKSITIFRILGYIKPLYQCCIRVSHHVRSGLRVQTNYDKTQNKLPLGPNKRKNPTMVNAHPIIKRPNKPSSESSIWNAKKSRALKNIIKAPDPRWRSHHHYDSPERPMKKKEEPKKKDMNSYIAKTILSIYTISIAIEHHLYSSSNNQ